MKVIVVIKPARGRAYNLLRHCYLSRGRQPTEVASVSGSDDRVCGVINGLTHGGLVRNAGEDARSLIADLPENRAQVRHVVLSVEETYDPESRQKAFAALADLCLEFAEKFAPGTPYIGVLHEDRLHPHAHLIFKNADGANEGALCWNRADLAEMQSMEWVSDSARNEFSIQPGRSSGRTRREGTGLPYPFASLDALKLATATISQLEKYESANIFTNGRRSASGETKSVTFNNRSISMSTIRQLAAIRGYMGGAPRSFYTPCRRSRSQGPRLS